MKKTLVFQLFLLFFIPSVVYPQLIPKPALAIKVDEEWHIINEFGSTLWKSSTLLDVEAYSEGLLSGYVMERGKPVSIYYDDYGIVELMTSSLKAYPFNNNRTFIVHETNKERFEYIFGAIDLYGNFIAEMKYLDMQTFSEGNAYLMNNIERGYIDTNGKFLFKLPPGIVGYGFTEGLSPVSNAKTGRFGYIDTNGKEVIPYRYFEGGNFSEGLARVFTSHHASGHGKFGFINKKGDMIISPIYEETSNFKEGLVFVAIPTGKSPIEEDDLIWRVINKDGTALSDYIFTSYKNFSDGVAAVQCSEDRHWYYIDKNSKPITEHKYLYSGSYAEGKAFVIDTNKRKLFVDKKGNILFELPFNTEIVFDCRTNEKFK